MKRILVATVAALSIAATPALATTTNAPAKPAAAKVAKAKNKSNLVGAKVAKTAPKKAAKSN
jgi:hypothetical protein